MGRAVGPGTGLHSVPARRGSHRRSVWSVCGKLECRELVRLLRRHPLRGRKRRASSRSGPPRWHAWSESLQGPADAADALRSRRGRAELQSIATLCRPTAPSRPAEERESEPWRGPRYPGFLGGFFTGEGSFSLHGKAALSVHLRADDADLLRTFRDAFAVGSVSRATPPGVNPSVRWSVCRLAELPQAIAMLDAAVLRGRKRREYEAWRLGAAEYARGRDRDEAVIAGPPCRLRRHGLM